MTDEYPYIPSQGELYIPILKNLSDNKIITVKELVQKIIISQNLPDDILDIKITSGKPVLHNRVEQACSNLRKKGLITYPPTDKQKLKNRRITELGLKVLNENLDPKEMPDVSETDADDSDEATGDELPSNDGASFFDFLQSKHLRFETETVEFFLLSLKAKQFLILSGGTGTGKTKLAQAYGQYISRTSSPRNIVQTVSLNDADTHMAFELNKEDNPYAPLKTGFGDRDCRFKLGPYEGTGTMSMNPRLRFENTEDPDGMIQAIDDLRKTSDEAELTIFIPRNDDSDSRFEIVAVGSNWTDSRQVVGYMNSITGEYIRTQSLNLMLRSQNDMNPYLLILDEMNLSHVERYFSDMLSSMESGSPISLQSDGKGAIPGKLALNSNLFIVGTVNLDETTYMFSPKVLDRANVIEFKPVPVKDYIDSKAAEYAPSGNIGFLQDAMAGLECRSMSAVQIAKTMGSVEGNNGFIDSIKEDLNSIQGFMTEMKLPFGFRTVDEIFRFLYVAWVYENRGAFSNWKKYLDAQICQKIIPKIHGNSSISGSLSELESFCSANGYNRSSEKLRRMTDVLKNQRYVSFNC